MKNALIILAMVITYFMVETYLFLFHFKAFNAEMNQINGE